MHTKKWKHLPLLAGCNYLKFIVKIKSPLPLSPFKKAVKIRASVLKICYIFY